MTGAKKILVTGASGFIGNYVVRELLKAGHTVIASSSNPDTVRHFDWINRVIYLEFDLNKLQEEINYYEYFHKPDLLIHLSWEGLPNYKSLFHFENNLPRQYAFLKNIISNGCTDVTIAGTCFEYGFHEGKLSEDLVPDPSNSYAVAKVSLYNFLKELKKIENFNFKWVRFFYLYGKGQNPGSLFSQLELAIMDGLEVFNMSGGEQIRDYLGVETAASYFTKIALQNRVNGIINCCSGKGISVRTMVENYLKENGKKIHLNLGYYDYPDYEPMSFWGDNTKLQSILNE